MRLDDAAVWELRVQLVLGDVASVLVDSRAAKQPCEQWDSDARDSNPRNEDTNVHSDSVLGVENDRADNL